MNRYSYHQDRSSITSRLARAVVLLVFGLTSTVSQAQNLEEISLKKGLDVSGSVNLSAVGYHAIGIAQRRDPFNWFATGNLNLTLFGYSAPLSFSYSNAGQSFSQPFNQFSFSPQYKWVKTYIGYNAMTFSNYTLNGHVFLGGGVELTPGRWRVAAMYGRLRKAVPFAAGDTIGTNASFKRMGYGLKVGYDHNGSQISANIFTARDELNSIPFVLYNSALAPKQNVAMSLTGRKTFLKRFFVEAEYAISALNTDTRANGTEADSTVKPTHNLIRGLLPENATSRYYDAVNASIGYQGNFYSLQFRYERIAPEYQTLGAYYFNNDMRNITVIPQIRLLQSRLNLGANIGWQQNNLDDARNATTRRTVGAFNVAYNPNERWSITGNYSNFTSYANMKPRLDPYFNNTLDTLNFYQISQTSSLTVLRNLGTSERPQSVMVTGSYQQSRDKSQSTDAAPSDFININAAYTYAIPAAQLTLSLAGNLYEARTPGQQSTYWGPTLNATRSFLDKSLRAAWITAYNQTSSNAATASPVVNNRLSLTYTPKNGDKASKHNLAVGMNWLRKLKGTAQMPAYTELTGTLNYTYSF